MWILSLALLLATIGAQPIPLSSITWADFTRMLATEVDDEFHPSQPSNWNRAIQEEWQVVREREMITDDRRLEVSSNSPFLICDIRYGESGASCKEHILQNIGGITDMTTVYNKNDMTCFLAELPASVLEHLPSGIAAIPLTPEMKMAPRLMDSIETGNVTRIEVTVCPGLTGVDRVKAIATVLVERLLHPDQERRLASFLESRKHRSPKRAKRWKRRLTNANNCDLVLSNMTVVGSKNMFTLELEERNEDHTDCLHAIAADLALQPEVCGVGAYQEAIFFNSVASGIIQSGSKNYKPLYEVGITGKGQVVSLSDTGVDIDNCYFYDSEHSTPKSSTGAINHDARKVVQYYTFADSTDQRGGHGTHVAGSIAGRSSRNGQREEDDLGDGVAYDAKLAVYDIGDANGRLRTPGIFSLFSEGYRASARIHSASWGTRVNYYTSTDAEIDDLLWRNKEFIFVVAAGNDGNFGDRYTVSTPAVCKNGIAVGASQNDLPSNAQGAAGSNYMAWYSSLGPTQDGRRKPDIVAPGQYTLSAKASPSTVGECGWPNGLDYKSGTSMAAPLVSGAAALVRQYFMEGWHKTGEKSSPDAFIPMASLVKAVLLNGAQDMVGVESRSGQIKSSSPYDDHQGFGRVSLLQSLPLKGKNDIKGIFVNDKLMTNGQVDEFRLQVDRTSCDQPLSVSLVWTDPHVSSFCRNGCVVNDLDLSISRNGQIYYPNGLNRPDDVNNAERIRIENPLKGEVYTVRVKGTQLLQDQEYSLAITGCIEPEAEETVPTQRPTRAPSAPTKSPTPSPTAQRPSSRPTSTQAAPTRRPSAPPTRSPTPGPTKSSESLCVDTSDRFSVNSTSTEGCSWLSSPSNRYLCNYYDVALACPKTCSACDLLPETIESSKKAEGILDGKVRWYGTMFDLQAKQAITIRSFDLHFNSKGSYRVQVFTVPGRRRPSNDNEWNLVCDSEFAAEEVKDYGQTTTIPESDCVAIDLKAGEFVTLYVTIVGAPQLVLRNENGVNNGKLIDNEDLTVYSGVAVTYMNEGRYDGFAFNGNINYSTEEVAACRNSPGLFQVDALAGYRSCEWLEGNLNRFGYVCQYKEQGDFCRETCGFCDNS